LLGSFAKLIFKRTYAIDPDETWEECADRVATFVAGDDHKDLRDEFKEAITQRKFMPGGRYLAQSGKDIPQLTNCFLLRAEDSREGWAALLGKHVTALSTGGGVGTFYGDIRPSGTPIKRFGGVASGPISLMNMVNEIARHVMAGGKRRSALWAGLPWNHSDIEKFISAKDWPTAVKAMKEQDFNFPAPLDMTNISVALDDEFFRKIKKDPKVQNLYYRICKNMCKTGEPGFSIDIKGNSSNVLRNPCQPGWATVLTPSGIKTFNEVEEGSVIWSGSNWTRISKKWSTGIKKVYKYYTTASIFVGTENHNVYENGTKISVKDAQSLDVVTGPKTLQIDLKPQNIMDGLVIGDGSVHKTSNNLVYLQVGEKDQDYHTSEIQSLFVKERPGLDKTAWEICTTITPDELPYTWLRIIPERFYKGNIQTKLGFLRGLYSANGSVCGNRITLKQTSLTLICQTRDMLSSVGIRSYYTINKPTKIQPANGKYESKQSYDLNITTDREKFIELIGFLQPYKISKIEIKPVSKIKTTYDIKEIENCGYHEVFDITVEDPNHTYWTGGCLVSNCTEVVSATDSDCCNLGSINFANIKDVDELKKITRLAIRFLYLGTYRSWLPHEDFYTVREKDRRIGLGLMGLHEWCLRNGERYEPNGQLGKWLSAWANISDDEATKFSKKLKGTRPIAVRAIAPTGTIGIIAETTTGIEPVFCVAYKRRYLGNDGKWQFEYVVDPTVQKLVSEGILADPNDVEDSQSLARYVERRIRMQAFVQSFVDQAISSTINLPEWGEPGNSNAKTFSEILLEYLPQLRGITVYPSGARPGEPLTRIRYETALKHNAEIKQDEDNCSGGVCGL
jgi:ribonucleotide reductase alpha subunit